MIQRDFFCHSFLSSHGSNFLTYLYLVLSKAQQIMNQQTYQQLRHYVWKSLKKSQFTTLRASKASKASKASIIYFYRWFFFVQFLLGRQKCTDVKIIQNLWNFLKSDLHLFYLQFKRIYKNMKEFYFDFDEAKEWCRCS